MKIRCYLCGSTDISPKLYCTLGLVVKLCHCCEVDEEWREKVKQKCRGETIPKIQINKRVVIPHGT